MTKKSTEAWNRGIFLSLVKMFHFIAIVQFGYSVYYECSYVHDPNEAMKSNRTKFGGKFKFLTFIDAILQCGYFIIALLNDFFGSNEVAPKKTPIIRCIKDYIFATFAFPVAFNVGVTFWSLFFIDRELVFPKALDAFFPNWLNHIMHTNIMIFIVMEMFTSFRKYPSRNAGLAGLSLFMAAYLGWIHVIKYKANVWVYPVLEKLPLPMRIVFFAACLVFSIFLYFLGEFTNEQVWVKEIKHASKAKAGKVK